LSDGITRRKINGKAMSEHHGGIELVPRPALVVPISEKCAAVSFRGIQAINELLAQLDTAQEQQGCALNLSHYLLLLIARATLASGAARVLPDA
jgi:hypothetical protein